MRARWLKPEFFTDKKVATLTAEAALVYEALWCWADDGGVCVCDPDYLKSQAFYRWDLFTPIVISKALRDLYDLKVILVYKVGDDYYASIRHWTRHQKVHKPAKFRHPRPDEQLTLSSSLLPPVIAGTEPGHSQASPPPRHLDSKTPRGLDGDGSAAPSPDDAGTVGKQEPPRTTPPPPNPLPDPDVEIPPVHVGKTAGERSLALLLETDRDRLSLTALCAVVPTPAVWVAECQARLEGMNSPGGKVTTPRQLAVALSEFVGSGRHLESPPSFRLFKAFLDKATVEPEGTTTSVDENGHVPRPAKGSPVSTGEAGAILARLKSDGERDQPPTVRQAVRALGGIDAIRSTRPDRWGFLLRDFASALVHAAANPESIPEPKPFEPPVEGPERPAMRAMREREEAWLVEHPGESLPVDFHYRRPPTPPADG